MKASTFIQLHMLTAYPPSNLNRDDMGRPKTAIVGGVPRLRVSSQSLKRAWRTSDVFQRTLAGHIGTRTKHVAREVLEILENAGFKEAKTVAKLVAQQFGKLKKEDKEEIPETEQLVHLSPSEQQAIRALAEKAGKGENVEEDAKHLLGKAAGAADIALFGRMLADSPSHNVEAAAQVGHAFSIHEARVEEDYFTAVDDLARVEDEEGAGASHIGIVEFGSGIFYEYVCVNRTALKENLENEGLACQTMRGLVEAMATVSPTGKKASFGSSARASYLLAEMGTQSPRSLMSAFVKPVRPGKADVLQEGISILEKTRDCFDRAYGTCASERVALDVVNDNGTLQEVLDFVSREL